MNNYVTGSTIKLLREQKGYTQRQLAEKLMVSDKAVSKWESGRGLPDISLIEPLAK
ncbi:MAG: helix-turn-helix transcriptional regulator, partial [Eubacteriales bacterium]|nr:helix-turn-helix transcriptional regulator [Eubacteriales bacterium]